MNNAPPEGSKISVHNDDGFQIIVIPNSSGNILRVLTGAFLIFWLGGWAVGWWSAAKEIVSGSHPGNMFLIFWLGAWTVGGIFAFWFIYRIMRPSVPETLKLKNQYIEYDSGVPSFQFTFGFVGFTDYWRQLFPKRKKIHLTSNELRTFALREHSSGNRLTVDVKNERLEIAPTSTEIEKEWLYKKLSEKYT